MDLDEETLRHVARLARLELSEEEIAVLRPQLERILLFVAAVREAPTPIGDPAAAFPPPMRWANLRQDVPSPPLPLDEVLAQAPERDGAFFVVPRILGGGTVEW